tara:strand:+ start:403 stop:600 length:198 start_codon:yes stop_codon:yes gene_type:complete
MVLRIWLSFKVGASLPDREFFRRARIIVERRWFNPLIMRFFGVFLRPHGAGQWRQGVFMAIRMRR